MQKRGYFRAQAGGPRARAMEVGFERKPSKGERKPKGEVKGSGLLDSRARERQRAYG